MNNDQRWPGVRFHPWQGKHYGANSTLGLPLLIVGESHYQECGTWSADHLSEAFTSEVVQECGYVRPFFKKVLSLFPDSKTAGFWDQVSFYNYVQFPLVSCKHRPTKEMFKASEKPFEVVLNTLQPDAVLVLGQATWYGMPYLQYLKNSKTIVSGAGEQIPAHEYVLQGGKVCPATYVNHPSSWGWKLETWKSVAEELVQRAKQSTISGFPKPVHSTVSELVQA